MTVSFLLVNLLAISTYVIVFEFSLMSLSSDVTGPIPRPKIRIGIKNIGAGLKMLSPSRINEFLIPNQRLVMQTGRLIK